MSEHLRLGAGMINYDFLYNKDFYGADLYAEHMEERDLTWTILENVTLIPFKDVVGNMGGGLVDQKDQYIDGTGLHAGFGCSYPHDEPVSIRNDPVVFLGLWPNIWGHCLTDNIRRLWVLDNQEFMDKYGKCSFIYTSYLNEKGLIPNFMELLEIIGAGALTLEPVNEITLFRKVILPDECFRCRNDGPRSYITEFGTRLYTKEYKRMLDRVRDYGEKHFVRSEEDTNIYFTGRHRTLYKEFGERKLELYFQKLGYKVIAPEEYTFREQLNMLLNCTNLVSTAGSLAHNIVFMRDHSRVCLIPRTSYITEYQFALDTIHDLEIDYIDSTLSPYVHKGHPWGGPNYYIISTQLQEYFKTNVPYMVNQLKFFVFKRLSYTMNEVSEGSEYYKEVADRYVHGDNTVHVNQHWHRMTRKLRLWKIAAMIIKWLEAFER